MFNWFYQAENEGEKMEILQDKEYAHNVTIENVELIVWVGTMDAGLEMCSKCNRVIS